MDLQLSGKRAMVCGASRGLGYAIARGLAGEGCQVAINSRDPDRIAESARKLSAETSSLVIGLSGDVTSPGIPEELIHRTIAAFGGLDLLVTNSGGPPAGKFVDFDDGAWRNAFELNMLSHVRLIRAALPELRKSKIASVLTITSYSVKQPIPNLILSNSIRSATIGLTKSLALEMGGEGIRFNSILPAWTETERVFELMAHRAKVNGTSLEEEFAKQAKDSPMGRMGRPDEFANAAVFLLSPVASYITGLMLTVDGGMYKGMM
jgi:3-oxoacyl-[acyl-carrier protein] reductase